MNEELAQRLASVRSHIAAQLELCGNATGKLFAFADGTGSNKHCFRVHSKQSRFKRDRYVAWFPAEDERDNQPKIDAEAFAASLNNRESELRALGRALDALEAITDSSNIVASARGQDALDAICTLLEEV